MDLTQQGAGVYAFPILKSQEILLCIEELGIELSQQELTDPIRHKEKLRTVWSSMLHYCTGKDEQALQASDVVKQELQEKTKFPTLHEDLGDMFFFRTLRALLKAAGYSSFSLSDMVAPSPKRLRIQLSALLNFIKFREEQVEVLELLNEPRQKWVEAIAQLEEEHEIIQRELAQTESMSKEKSDELEAIAKECQVLEGEIAKQNKLQTEAREEANTLKRQANDLKDELATAQWTLQEVEAEEEQLRGQIVSSPDRRKAEVKTARDELDKLKANVIKLDDSVQRGKTYCRNLKQAIKDVTAISGSLDGLQQTYNRHSEISQKVEKTLQDIAAKTNEQKVLIEKVEEADRDVNRSEEKIEAQRKQHHIQMGALQEALDHAKTQLLQVEKERRDGMIRIQEWENEVRRLEDEIETERATTQEQTNQMISEYKVVEEEFLEIDRKRMERIQASSVIAN